MKTRNLAILALVAAVCAGFTACAPKKTLKDDAKNSQIAGSKVPGVDDGVEELDAAGNRTNTAAIPANMKIGEEPIAGEAPAVPEADIRGREFAAASDLQTVYFPFDRYAITKEAQTTLTANTDALKSKKNSDFLVEGHCDERGTIEYNIALGQKRAKEVRNYYMTLGIPGESITTISYGKEKPVCNEADESCWSKNRRAETKLRQKAS